MLLRPRRQLNASKKTRNKEVVGINYTSQRGTIAAPLMREALGSHFRSLAISLSRRETRAERRERSAANDVTAADQSASDRAGRSHANKFSRASLISRSRRVPRSAEQSARHLSSLHRLATMFTSAIVPLFVLDNRRPAERTGTTSRRGV
jgi:hypothetical protein